MVEVLLVIIIIILIINASKSKSRDVHIQFLLTSLQQKLNVFHKDIVSGTLVKDPDAVTVEKPLPKEQPVEIFEVEKPAIIQPVLEKPAVEIPIKVISEVEEIPISTPYVAPTPFIPKKSWFETFKENNPDLEKFIGENLINKIGILILVLGISFFVKFAIDKDWINEPARVGIGILCGALVMAIAHKLKKNYAAFSSVLVAGAISIFYFTIAIAFHEYQLFSQTVAFIIMVVITIFSVLVSVSYNRQELAILSLIGGFAVPFMVSTGSGNYIVLLSYIAILNMGILAIAYFKKWKIVTIIAFVFTSMLYGFWYNNELYDGKLHHFGALLFATLFYFIFSMAVVLSNIRNKGVFTYIEYVIMVANTFFFFGIGMGIIHNWGIDFKGLFALLLAFYNVIYAIVLYKKFGLDKSAIYLLIGLALTFVTLTIPLQFDGNQITLFWAAEAVLLFWLSQKSKIARFKWGAYVVQILTLGSLLMDWIKYENPAEPLRIILNPLFISGIFVSVSLFVTYWLLKKEDQTTKSDVYSIPQYMSAVIVVAVITSYLTGFLEISHQAYQYMANTASALSFPVAYHFVFAAVVLFLMTKFKNEMMVRALLIISTISIVLYMVKFYRLPSEEMVQNLVADTNSQYAYYFHYIILACLIYFGFRLFKKANQMPKIALLNGKVMPWLFVFATVYILSNEVMVHSLNFSTDSIDMQKLDESLIQNGTDDYSMQFEKSDAVQNKLDNIKLQIIKIGYPIVWGLFSFIFLIIGIKKQWKDLRIISLALLGLTILKLFIYDIRNVSETGKIVAFILLGVLILVISFVYQKVKKLVVDDVSKQKTDEDSI